MVGGKAIGGVKGNTIRTSRVPDQTLVCQKWGIKKGCTCRTLRVPDWRLGRQG